jgi:hypothetical protein
LPTGNAAAAKPKKKRAEEESEAEMTDEDGDPYEGMNKEKVSIAPRRGCWLDGERLQASDVQRSAGKSIVHLV